MSLWDGIRGLFASEPVWPPGHNLLPAPEGGNQQARKVLMEELQHYQQCLGDTDPDSTSFQPLSRHVTWLNRRIAALEHPPGTRVEEVLSEI